MFLLNSITVSLIPLLSLLLVLLLLLLLFYCFLSQSLSSSLLLLSIIIIYIKHGVEAMASRKKSAADRQKLALESLRSLLSAECNGGDPHSCALDQPWINAWENVAGAPDAHGSHFISGSHGY